MCSIFRLLFAYSIPPVSSIKVLLGCTPEHLTLPDLLSVPNKNTLIVIFKQITDCKALCTVPTRQQCLNATLQELLHIFVASPAIGQLNQFQER